MNDLMLAIEKGACFSYDQKTRSGEVLNPIYRVNGRFIEKFKEPNPMYSVKYGWRTFPKTFMIMSINKEEFLKKFSSRFFIVDCPE